MQLKTCLTRNNKKKILKENKSEFAIVTNLTTGNSEVFEKGKSLSKDFEKFYRSNKYFLSIKEKWNN